MGSTVDHDFAMYDGLAGNGMARISNGFEDADPAVGNDTDGEQDTCDISGDFYSNAESEVYGADIDLHQKIEELHYRHGDAGDSPAEMPGMPATEGPRGSPPRCGSPFIGDPAQAASLA